MPHMRSNRERKAMFARMNNPNQRSIGLVIPNPNQPSRTLFFAPKDPRLARIIKIDTPSNFRKSIKILSKGGLTLKERRALILAQNRAKAQLGRKNLSDAERREFTEISREKIPPTPTKLRTLRPVSATRVGAFKAVERRKELKKESTKESTRPSKEPKFMLITKGKGINIVASPLTKNEAKASIKFAKDAGNLPSNVKFTIRRIKSSHQSSHLNPQRKKKEVSIYSL